MSSQLQELRKAAAIRRAQSDAGSSTGVGRKTPLPSPVGSEAASEAGSEYVSMAGSRLSHKSRRSQLLEHASAFSETLSQQAMDVRDIRWKDLDEKSVKSSTPSDGNGGKHRSENFDPAKANLARSQKNAENAPTLAIGGLHTAENEPPKVCENPKTFLLVFKTRQW